MYRRFNSTLPWRIPPLVGDGIGKLGPLLHAAITAGKISTEDATAVQKDVNSEASAQKLAPIVRALLPKFDEKTTYGVLVTNEGDVIQFKSGGRDPAYGNYRSAGHVEAKAAWWIREHGSSGGVLYHNNTDGICGYCNTHVETLLPEKAKLYVVPPEDADPKNSRAIAEPTPYVGNNATPKPPSIQGTEPSGADHEN
jgi:hypothetical protein